MEVTVATNRVMSDDRRETALGIHLRELIAALDRRIPQLEREGEAAIARDSALLKEKAQKRLAQLETHSLAARPD